MNRALRVVTGLLLLLPVCMADTIVVTVPGNASGGFGSPSDQTTPFVLAIKVRLASSITITATGCVTDAGISCVTPDGFSFFGMLTPLQEAGLAGNPDTHVDGLIGAFVPAVTAANPNFKPIDNANPACSPGPCIDRTQVFFIGSSKTFAVGEAGTLYLGIDDFIVGDNGGSFQVTISTIPCVCTG